MPFGTLESSDSLGDIVALVEFRHGTETFTYTDHTQPIVYAGKTYTPLPLEHGAIKTTGKPDKTNFTVKLPSSAPVCTLYYKQAPSAAIQLVVFAGHVGDLDFKQVWTGRVQSVKFSGDTADLSLEPSTVSLQRSGLRLRYQTSCPHVLYGASCNATKTLNTFTITNRNTFRIYVAEAIVDPVNYIGGVIEYAISGGTAYSSIIRVNAPSKYFDISRNTVDIPNTVNASFGCNKSLAYCNSVFQNGPNFGGTPYIPFKNPVNKIIANYP